MIEFMAMANMRIRLPEHLKKKWDEMLIERKISQQDAVDGLVKVVLSFNDADLAQLALLGQLKPKKEHWAMIFKEIQRRRPHDQETATTTARAATGTLKSPDVRDRASGNKGQSAPQQSREE